MPVLFDDCRTECCQHSLYECSNCGYLTLTEDTTRVMNRIKAVYRGRGIACASAKMYSARDRDEWLKQLREPW